MAFEFTDTNFKESAIDSKGVAVVDFWAEWCGPCRMIGPIVEELANEYGEKAVIGKINVDSNTQTPAKFGIRNIPTLLVFKNGEVVDKQVGATNKATLAGKIDAQM